MNQEKEHKKKNKNKYKKKVHHDFSMENKNRYIKKVIQSGWSQHKQIKEHYIEYEDSLKARNEDPNYPSLFLVEYDNDFYFSHFCQKNMEKQETIKNNIKELIKTTKVNDNKTLSFWKKSVSKFKIDFKRNRKTQGLLVDSFDPQQIENTNFEAEVRIFRMQVDYTYKKLIRVFKLDTIFESQSVSEDVLEKNQILEKLTLLKLRLEYMSEVSLAKYYMQKRAPTVISDLKAFINEKDSSYDDKEIQVQNCINTAGYILSTLAEIKQEYIADYEKTISLLKDHVKDHKDLLDGIMGTLLIENNKIQRIVTFPSPKQMMDKGDQYETVYEEEDDDALSHDTETNLINHHTPPLHPLKYLPIPPTTLKHYYSTPKIEKLTKKNYA